LDISAKLILESSFHINTHFTVISLSVDGCLDNIKMDLGEVGWGDVDWIGLAKGRNRWRALVNSVLKLRVP
jgi:hypothetical protein